MRVSSDEQAQTGTSLATQTERCLAHVQAQEWLLVVDHAAPNGEADVFSDGGESGAKANRPALDRLMARVHAGEVDVVMVAKWDRLGRNLNHLTTLWGVLDTADVEAISLGDPESSGRKGRFIRNVMASIAEEEREVIRERTTLGRVARLREGGWSGGQPPLGFRVSGQGKGARLVLDDHEAAMIRRAVDLLLDHGLTTGEAAAALNAEGYLPRKAPRWDAALLRNHLVKGPWGGVWTYAKPAARRAGKDLVPEPIEVPVPALLEADRHAALLAFLMQTTSLRAHSTVHPLSGLLVGPCGHSFHGIARADRGRRRYRCSQSKDGTRFDRCTGPTLLAQGLDDLVWSKVVERLADPALLLAEAEEHLGILKTAETTHGDAYGRAEAEERRCLDALGDLLAAGVKGRWDQDAMQRAKASLDADLLAARQHLAMVALWRQETVQASGRLSAMHEAAGLADRLADADDALRAKVLRLFRVAVRVTECGPLGEALAVEVDGFMDHDLIAASLAPCQGGVLSLLKRTSRYGRNSLPGPKAGSSSVSSSRKGSATHRS